MCGFLLLEYPLLHLQNRGAGVRARNRNGTCTPHSSTATLLATSSLVAMKSVEVLSRGCGGDVTGTKVQSDIRPDDGQWGCPGQQCVPDWGPGLTPKDTKDPLTANANHVPINFCCHNSWWEQSQQKGLRLSSACWAQAVCARERTAKLQRRKGWW